MAKKAVSKTPVISNPWRVLQHYTDARIGLGRAGTSIPTEHLLAFQLAHAQARDAVHQDLDFESLDESLSRIASQWEPTRSCPEALKSLVQLHTKAGSRSAYLQRPDLGRQLSDPSRNLLNNLRADDTEPYDLAIVIADGLSARAVQENAAPLLDALCPALFSEAGLSWCLAPVCAVQHGRVAVGDEIGSCLNAGMVLLLVGERPGLSSPDSLGIYLTFAPRVGLTDASRNCISNVRPGGLKPEEAARKAFYLMTEARQKKLSGVQLKDRSEDTEISLTESHQNFLIPE
ncbi:ethanolamine ammonia-lyase small subunit [Oleiphilus messinensis]|uniref:Ethanolamine ammonia-lyase small subunit n=1 Tax=Oleiphilus messinensis TaxID=141451 RepID=A0A1Y0ID76_9GAMM|nr:ethanolamine ammonia-lyase subunit EutC [Oleiphilus messinensis]ARU58488.1 ethanolamine ammonia-lyase small subunit [Oleiphilus messinensis]